MHRYRFRIGDTYLSHINVDVRFTYRNRPRYAVIDIRQKMHRYSDKERREIFSDREIRTY